MLMSLCWRENLARQKKRSCDYSRYGLALDERAAGEDPKPDPTFKQQGIEHMEHLGGVGRVRGRTGEQRRIRLHKKDRNFKGCCESI